MSRYPHTLLEFEEDFRTEAACADYLRRLRWPEGFRCRQCGHGIAWKASGGRLVCQRCRHVIRMTVGTIFQDSHLPLRTWFRMIWWVTNQKTGMNALGLQRALGLGSYETAWACLHKLRRAMVRPGRERLTGRVEVDEIQVGGVEQGSGRGRHLGHKALVGVAAETRGRGMGRIRLHRVADDSAESLEGFVGQAVEPGSVVITDGFRSYSRLDRRGYRHQPRVVSGSGRTASSLLPRVHRVTALLKRWLLGVHQGGTSRRHLDAYLDEFTFRFNRRTSHHRGKLFFRLLEQAVQTGPAPYRSLVKRPKRRSDHQILHR